MKSCLNCSNPTSRNEYKFCSQSCSASYNNRGVRRHGTERFCAHCTKKIQSAKYCSNDCQHAAQKLAIWTRIESSGFVKNDKEGRAYLLEKHGYKCWQCEVSTWLGHPVPLVMDHIDGHSENATLTNLRMLCCNCDGLTDTYKNRNIGNGRASRRQRYAEGKSY